MPPLPIRRLGLNIYMWGRRSHLKQSHGRRWMAARSKEGGRKALSELEAEGSGGGGRRGITVHIWSSFSLPSSSGGSDASGVGSVLRCHCLLPWPFLPPASKRGRAMMRKGKGSRDALLCAWKGRREGILYTATCCSETPGEKTR